MPTSVYDPKEYTFSFGGVACPGGFGDSSGIKVSMTTDNINIKKGIDGKGMAVRSNDDQAAVEVTLLKTSSYNAYLSGLMLRQRLFSVPGKAIQIASVSGDVVFHGDEAWIAKEADLTVDKDGADNVWTFKVVSGKLALSGGLPAILP
jgi:hypothetical protein